MIFIVFLCSRIPVGLNDLSTMILYKRLKVKSYKLKFGLNLQKILF